jgi:hypothetical protein
MNQLKVKEQQAIIALYEQGWSKRKVAREQGTIPPNGTAPSPYSR